MPKSSPARSIFDPFHVYQPFFNIKKKKESLSKYLLHISLKSIQVSPSSTSYNLRIFFKLKIIRSHQFLFLKLTCISKTIIVKLNIGKEIQDDKLKGLHEQKSICTL